MSFIIYTLTIKMIKSRMIVQHVPCKQDTRNAYKILVLKSEGKNNLKDQGTDGPLPLK
jgi:hypothetical protein